MKPQHAWFEGRLVPYAEAKVGILTHAFNYGTAVLGGIRGYWNDDEEQLFVFRPRDHFRRLRESARLLRIRLDFDEERLTQMALELLRAEGYRADCYLRPLAYKAGEGIGVGLDGVRDGLTMAAVPFGRVLEREEGVHVTISSWQRLDDNAIPARGKITGAYVNSALAKSDAVAAGFDEAILLNRDGHVAEGSAENVFMLRRGVVVTPPVTENILEGISRRTVIALLRDELGREVVERPIDRTELYLADELWFSATGAQLCAITRIDHRPVGGGEMGPLVRDLRALYFDIVRGRVPKYRSWNEPVYEANSVGVPFRGASGEPQSAQKGTEVPEKTKPVSHGIHGGRGAR